MMRAINITPMSAPMPNGAMTTTISKSNSVLPGSTRYEPMLETVDTISG